MQCQLTFFNRISKIHSANILEVNLGISVRNLEIFLETLSENLVGISPEVPAGITPYIEGFSQAYILKLL